MERILKVLVIWFFLDVGLPSLYFAVTERIDSGLACMVVTLVVFAISTPFVILSLPLWIRAQKLLKEHQLNENSQD